jgi:hypothetical protein
LQGALVMFGRIQKEVLKTLKSQCEHKQGGLLNRVKLQFENFLRLLKPNTIIHHRRAAISKSFLLRTKKDIQLMTSDNVARRYY